MNNLERQILKSHDFKFNPSAEVMNLASPPSSLGRASDGFSLPAMTPHEATIADLGKDILPSPRSGKCPRVRNSSHVVSVRHLGHIPVGGGGFGG